MQIREVVVGFVDLGVLAVVRLPFDQDDQCLGIADTQQARCHRLSHQKT